jgi:hypothetical protein
MKYIFTGLALICLAATFSCTKTNNVRTTVYDTTTVIFRDTVYQKSKNPIAGLWVGTYIVPSAPTDSFYYSFDIQPNGRMITTAISPSGGSSSSTGPWQLSGTAFTATLTQLGAPTDVQAISAAYDSVAGTLAGTADFTSGGGNNATFLLLRVQD